VIGSADRLGIHVWKNPELSVEVPVRPDGKISVPLLDDVQAAGLTALELKELLTRRMDEYVSNADITVVVRSTDSKRAYVMGEVRSPGAIVLNTELSILDVLASVGGFDTFADKDNVRIIRRTAQGEVEYGFDYGAYIAGDAPGTNIPILPGDTIIVPD
jgi:polysaccharide export outer membrane protein